ncbi:prophage tail fiber N-terminal domain-containing protein [Serratia ureilytica]|uniref:prophage tail fiber N-terminal domain-containing protein n=1 Tax=Serratia ureilytica TaxID=300181 RepID=UPI002DBA0854|nr:prophage tail fiber N-terminal domain-containing protein [Serratia ureilytica]MEB7893104.1 prophage tail fiber N-terminal domain-containing protein [Serratia ureilytica]
MAVLISGKLIGPNGEPRPNVTIMLVAVKTSSAVVKQAPSISTTSADGSYSLSVEVGTHNVMIEAYGRPFEKVGQITVYSDSKPGTLNDFLTTPGQDELTPAIVAMVDDMRAAAALYAKQASISRDEAQAAAEIAQNISDAGTYYITPEDPDGTIAGLAGTLEGKSFRVAQGIGADASFIYYRKTDGKAIAIADAPSKAITDLIKKSAGKPFMRWRDKLGMVAAYWSADTDGGVGFVSKLVEFSRNGFFSENTEVSDNVIRNRDFSVVKSEDGSFRVRDRLGLTLLKAKAGNLYLPKINAILNAATKLSYGKVKISIGTGGDIIAFRDSRGVVGLRIDKNCVVHAKIAGYDGNLPVRKMTEDSIISLVQSFADSAKSNFGRRIFNDVPALGNSNKSKKKVQFWIVYGQSFSVGAQSGVALSTAQTLGNVMLGGSPRGTSFGNLATEYTYSPVGGENIFYPLVEVLQSNLGEIVSNTNGGYGETIASSFANNLKAYHNQNMGVENDEDFIIGVACCGVSGRTIEQLKKGAIPEIYNRVETALDGIAEAAAAAGYDWEIGGIIYMQGENDNSQSFEFYYPRLQSMHDTLIASCMGKSGQDRKPLFMLNQLGNGYVRGIGVPAAQIELALKNDNVVLVGSYQGLSNPGAHLSANSYRVIGAMFARDAFRHMSGYGSYPFKCEKGVFQDNAIYLGMTPHITPLKFNKVFNGWGYVEHSDKGISVADSSGAISHDNLTVTAVSPTVIKVLCSRKLTGKVTVTIGDSAHGGTHNICDGGGEVAYNKWEYGVPNQYPQENIPELVGKGYSLATFAAIQTIECNEV